MKLTLIDKKDEAKGTKSFFWTPERPVEFLPGQYFYYTLPKLNYPDARGMTRHFTISSSPTEEGLRLTTRIRQQSGYKKTLDELPAGTAIDGQGPEGTFTFNPDEQPGPHVFIAGGIGITPFRSIIKFMADKNINVPVFLIYSNSGSDIVFKTELDEWVGKINLTIGYFNSEENGHLNEKAINKYLTDWGLESKTCGYWIAGPTAFASAMEDILEKMKIDSEKIKTDKFNGY